MHVQAILRAKGQHVVTIDPSATVADAVRSLTEHGLGALVVSADGEHIAGIVSERDIVRRLATDPDLLTTSVSAVMTADVRTCSLGDKVESLMAMMTAERIRHVPVVTDGRLVGIVSIGDAVKHRLETLASENAHLHEYVSGVH